MKVKEIFTSPDRWTQGVEARDARGTNVGYYSPNAVSYCLLGAINHCYQGFDRYRKIAVVANFINPACRNNEIDQLDTIVFCNDDARTEF